MYALKVTKLKKIYSKGVVALKGIDLTVKKGDFFALLGPNGAGKSTTIGVLCSLVNKTSGTVEVFGHDIDQDPSGAKSCIGVVPQEFNFNPFEKLNQIIINQAGYYGIERKLAKELADHYLNKLGLWAKRNSNALRLSGGMKRRLMIARALVNQPPLLILDEPTAGVDIELRHTLWKLLTELNKAGTTIILTTHYLEEAEHLCRQVAIIDNGEIIKNAKMKSILQYLPIQTLLLDLTEPVDQAPLIEEYTFQLIDNYTIQVELKHNQTVNDLFVHLNSLGKFKVAGIRNKKSRLEELFVHLTQK